MFGLVGVWANLLLHWKTSWLWNTRTSVGFFFIRWDHVTQWAIGVPIIDKCINMSFFLMIAEYELLCFETYSKRVTSKRPRCSSHSGMWGYSSFIWWRRQRRHEKFAYLLSTKYDFCACCYAPHVCFFINDFDMFVLMSPAKQRFEIQTKLGNGNKLNVTWK